MKRVTMLVDSITDVPDEERRVALSVLHGVLLDLARLMAPFTPFFTGANGRVEGRGYQTLRVLLHFAPCPSRSSPPVCPGVELNHLVGVLGLT